MKVSSKEISLTQEGKEKLAALNFTLKNRFVKRGLPRGVKGKLQEHRKLIESLIKCDYCEYNSIHRSNVMTHELEKHRGTKQTCMECDYSNYFSSKIRKHYKSI